MDLHALPITTLASKPWADGQAKYIKHGTMSRRKAVFAGTTLLPNPIVTTPSSYVTTAVIAVCFPKVYMIIEVGPSVFRKQVMPQPRTMHLPS